MGIRERKEREKSERRQMILEAAKKLFMLNGYKSTTMEEIAAKAELSPATIYLYFKNKDALYATLNLIDLEYLSTQISKAYNNKDLSVEEKILKFKDAMYKTFQHDPLLLRIILHVQLEDTLLLIDRKLLEQLNQLSHKTMTMIADIYKEGVRQGKFDDGHERAHADILWATFTGIVLWEEAKRKINPKKNFLKPTLDRAFEIFCRGIKKQEVLS